MQFDKEMKDWLRSIVADEVNKSMKGIMDELNVVKQKIGEVSKKNFNLEEKVVILLNKR